jgi:phosphatidylserine/phosphatidylglycerophosphate/cardiolipin synthase-like enzyme
MAFSFTADNIADAMLERADAGITVTGVFEENQYYANIGTEYDRLHNAELDIRLDGNNRNMHHKTIIIDDRIVILGSYNFSRNAEIRNDENTLIIFNSEIAELYTSEFQRIFSKASMD